MTLGKQSSYTARAAEKEQQEQKPMKGWEPIIHCDRTSPRRLQLNPHREQRSVDKKVWIHLPKNGLPGTWREKKKTTEEPIMINSSLFRTKMFFLSSLFLWFDSPRRKLVRRMCNMKQKKAVHDHRRGGKGREKNPQNCFREGKKTKKAWGLNVFSFCKLEEEKKKRSVRCSLCL